MNHSLDSSNANENALIDRLVAGELSGSERRDLLLRLEVDPDGWRRCALAFLEDQAWRQALSGSALTVPNPEPVPLVSSFPEQKKHWVRFVPIAASILVVAFLAGFAASGVLRGVPRVEVAKQEPKAPSKPSKSPEKSQVREVGWVDLVDNASGETPPVRFPILSGPGLNEEWLRDQAPSVSEYVRARWEREGYQVQERRNLVSVTLKDGRRVSIPVDEVAVDYVGQKPL